MLVCAIAFTGVFLAMSRSLGWGFLAVITVGYFSGVIRANYLGVFTTMMFDAAVLALYLGFLIGKSRWPSDDVAGAGQGFRRVPDRVAGLSVPRPC